MLLALGLGKLSLKLLHDSCGLRLVTNVGQQCSESHSQHQHSQQQQNIRRGTHNRDGIAAKLLLFSYGHAEVASQWNPIQGQDFFQRLPIDECERVQAVNAGRPILGFDVVQTAGRNHKGRFTALFRKRHTCRVNLTQ